MPARKKRIITIGSFDGVHFGHQALIRKTVEEARRRKMKSLVLTFDTPPKMFFEGGNKPILSTPLEKDWWLKKMGVDEIIRMPLRRVFFSTRPFAFFRRTLLREMGARGLVVGLDFRFGADRSAGAVDLVRWGVKFEIPVWVISPVKKNGKTVSSTRIREFIRTGQFGAATALLGHPFVASGRVVSERGMGRRLGFPTANIRVPSGKLVPSGVFAVRGWISGGRGRVWEGVANVGTRPTFFRRGKRAVEAHFFARGLRLKGKTVFLEFCRKIRVEKKFRSAAALRKAVASDGVKAKAFFKRNKLKKQFVF